MSLGYCHYYFFNSFSLGTAFRRPNLTSTDGSRSERVITLNIISDIISHYKKYILIRHLLPHTLYEMYFSVVNVTIIIICMYNKI